MVIAQAKLESKLWEAANSLRGAMDAADYKNYVFPVFFWKWISDNWELGHTKFLADVERARPR
ncbi:type I restriction-modification system subunit M N-terminal domain-containing protein [Corynebacterium pseudotuberculosis]|uniref:SAM-dependent DNA methyltransferase n=1 Tax=Corynebacterium pseudotuberculosis (strain C231) TaxID=681645 RepID=D9QBK4_CORP2|nr:type I restriction-modification system subunit M N-terminal domain-containing protein [Corynebacterium pseudotuberculosis]ADK29264.1 SAM-dependent DNA methyltransferase [Corynebacterium pseudotuberculosis FRC41]ADL10930.1 SAM-dependent DNA methyltransferase [Corynebacterium pseudotuberculosis C231]ADO26730.1 SAM-dependent DNA methyltransferase [Corynebacterium pseudotuberculosis I19]AEK49204.1 SAM-dependent DNA methyltransferase [Corynebacterium pseudotuberculosis 1002]AEK92793.1 Hypothetic